MVRRGVVSRGVSMNIRIDRCSFVTYIGDKTIVMVCCIVNVLGSTIRKSNGVGSGHSAVDVGSFGGVEGSFGVVIVDTVLEGVGSRGLVLVGWSRVVRSGMVGSGGRMVRSGGRMVWRGGRMVGSGSRSVLRCGKCACDQYSQTQKYLKQNYSVQYSSVQLVFNVMFRFKTNNVFLSFFNSFSWYLYRILIFF